MLLLLSFVQIEGLCARPKDGWASLKKPKPFETAVLDFVSGSSNVSPKAFVLSQCSPIEPSLEKQHVDYKLWLSSRSCGRYRVGRIEDLESVSIAVDSNDGVERRSLRASPSRVSVEWNALDSVLANASEQLWPGQKRRLIAELQTVLTYRRGDMFGSHQDQCEDNGQEAVLVVDLGLRAGRKRSYDGDAEMFFHSRDVNGTSGSLVGTWSASQRGDWVAFPMHRSHGVYARKEDRVVAVFTLIDPSLTESPLCSPYNGSCLKFHCRPGRACIET